MSPRPKKPRFCQCPYGGRAFKPTGVPMRDIKKVSLSRDELEALRLCDLEGLSQQEAGQSMGVSRGTVQRTVSEARKKVTKALINQWAIVFTEIS